MKNIFIIIILFGIGKNSFAQTSRLDSLRQVLKTSDNKEIKAEIMIELGGYYLFRNPDSAFNYLHRALNIASNDTLRIRTMDRLCAFYRYRRPDSTLYYANLALKLTKPYGLAWIEQDIMGSVMLAYQAMGNISQSLHLSLQALKLAEDNNLPWSVALNRAILGNLQSASGSFDQAIVNYKEALNYFRTTERKSFIASMLAFIGEAYAGLNLPDSAIYYTRLAEEIQYSGSSYFIWDILGRAYNKIGDSEKSLKYYHLSMRSTELFISFKGNLEIAKIYLARHERDSAMVYGFQALDIAKESGFYSNIIAANTFLADFYGQQDPERALKFAQEAIMYKDSLTDMERLMTITDFLNVDEEQRQNEIETTKKEFQYRLKMNALLGSSFTLLVVAFVLYRSRRQKQKAKKHIEAAYDQLTATQSQLIQSEKMASLGELTAGIAHEIQNPLNFVNNFSEINAELLKELRDEVKKGNLKEIETLAKDIEENEKKIKHHGQRAEGIVKGMLQHSRTSKGEKEPTDINILADEYLRLAYHGLRAKDKSFNADFRTEFDETLPKINVVPQDLGRVLLNLINNAFYAVDKKAKEKAGADSYKPEVIVATKKLDKLIEISVRDNGGGIPEQVRNKIFQPFFTTKPAGSGTGLGLSLSYDIVKAHGGEIKVESNENIGTEFIITIPNLSNI